MTWWAWMLAGIGVIAATFFLFVFFLVAPLFLHETLEERRLRRELERAYAAEYSEPKHKVKKFPGLSRGSEG